MKLFANGCSWTWGGALGPEYENNEEIRLKSVWPHHLGELLGADEVINLSMGCGSNQRILRTTLNWILKQKQEVLNQTVAVIQWTELSRYEYYNPKNYNDHFENHDKRWALAKVDCLLDAFKNESYEYVSDRNNKRLETYTEIEGTYRHIFECLALDNLFKKYNVKYYFWTMGIPSVPAEFQIILNNFSWLKTYTGWVYERVSESDCHPSLTGHKQIASYIYNEIGSFTNKNY